VVTGSTGILYDWIPAGGDRPGEVAAVVEAVSQNTLPGEPILALPNGSAYHFFTRRKNPTRYATFAIMITDAHRQDALDCIRRSPPACVIYDLETPRLDRIPDDAQFPGLLTWVTEHYELQAIIGSTLLLYPRQATAGSTISFHSPEELRQALAARPVLPCRLQFR
jgi:hypothetical protein